jgi:hypothetical protein
VRNGRNNVTKPMGFKNAAQTLTRKLSPEATREFTNLVTSVARQYSYDDSAMLKTVNRRLKSAAGRRKAWAVEVMDLLAEQGQKASA